jgi:hypothetical protein
MNEINKKHSNWVISTAASSKQSNASQQSINQSAASYAASANLGNMEIDALVFFVMMQIVKDVNDDLKQMMEEMKKQNEKKKALRDALNKIKRNEANQKEMLRAEYDSLRKLLAAADSPNNLRITDNDKKVGIASTVVSQKVTPAQVNQLKTELIEKLDAMSEMSEMMSLRLQMYMDRYTKFMNTLSNMMKKLSDTAETIIGNLK